MSDRIEVESDAYRRGVVLGLTLAELGILLVFVLLLLVGFEAFRGRPAANEVVLPASEAEGLRNAASRLRELHTRLPGRAELPLTDDFVRLVLAAADELRSSADTAAAASALREASAELQDVRTALSAQLAGISGAPELQARMETLATTAARRARELEAAQAALDTTQTRLQQRQEQLALRTGQLSQLQRQLADAGSGRVYPSCWVTADGDIDYVYNVELTSGGLRVYPRPRSGSADDDLRLPDLDAGATLSAAAFLRATGPLYEWSRANDCRFFVIVHDGTADHEKERFKQLLATVESHFYKLLSDAPAPF